MKSVAEIKQGYGCTNVSLQMYEQMISAAINISIELKKVSKHMEYFNIEYMNINSHGKFITTMWNDLIQKDVNYNVVKLPEMIVR